MRITGGSFRSRALRAPKGDRTRPTSDRVREALFSILVARVGREGRAPGGDEEEEEREEEEQEEEQSDPSMAGPSLSGERVLDLYAGTGALALEALSRGAAHATFVEEGRDALVALRGNIAELGVAKKAAVLAMSVERASRVLARVAEADRFTLVFADPPYKLVQGGEFVRTFAPIVQSGAFAPGATVVIEHASLDSAPELDDLSLVESRRYGDTTVSLYLYRSGN